MSVTCWLLSRRLCWTYLHRAAESLPSSSSWSSLEKHTLRWLRVPLDTKPSSSSLGEKVKDCRRHIQTFQVIINMISYKVTCVISDTLFRRAKTKEKTCYGEWQTEFVLQHLSKVLWECMWNASVMPSIQHSFPSNYSSSHSQQTLEIFSNSLNKTYDPQNVS